MQFRIESITWLRKRKKERKKTIHKELCALSSMGKCVSYVHLHNFDCFTWWSFPFRQFIITYDYSFFESYYRICIYKWDPSKLTIHRAKRNLFIGYIGFDSPVHIQYILRFMKKKKKSTWREKRILYGRTGCWMNWNINACSRSNVRQRKSYHNCSWHAFYTHVFPFECSNIFHKILLICEFKWSCYSWCQLASHHQPHFICIIVHLS